MSFLMRWFDALAEEEDEDLMQLMGRFYGPLATMSFLFPSFRRRYLPLTFFSFSLQVFLSGLHFVILVVTVVRELDNFELASLLIHYGLLLLFGILAPITMNILRKQNAQNHRSIISDVGHYQPGRIYSEDQALVIEKRINKETFQFLLLPGFVVVAAGFILIVPYLAKLTSPPSYTKNGANLNLPIPAYYPFPTHEGISHVVVVFLQLTTAALLAVTIACCLLMLLRVAQRIRFEYRVLTYAIESVFDRGIRLFKKKHEIGGTVDVDIDDPVYQYCVELCLRDSIIHHHKIANLVSGFEKVSSMPSFAAHLIGTGVIGLSLVNVLTAIESGDRQNAIMFTLLSIAEVLNMFMVSLIGEAITTESQSLFLGLYNTEWYNFNVRNRKLMLNFQVGITEPVIIKAGGLFDVCMDTFSSILNTAYSVFNLMNVRGVS